MTSPFVVNKECGAVAGNVRVLNNEKALIPKMLNVSFAFGNFREDSKTGTRIFLLDQWLRILLSFPMMLLMFTFIVTHPLLFY